MSDIDEENKEVEYTQLDILQYNYDISKDNYDKLLDDISDLWENVIQPYLEDIDNYKNGFLEELKKNSLLGQKKFYDFILKTNIGKKIYDDYIVSQNNLNKYLRKNPESNIRDTLYYSEKMYDSLYSLRDEHIEMLKIDDPNNWTERYTKEIEPLYNYF